MRRLKFLLLFLFTLALFVIGVRRFPVPLHGGAPLLQAILADALLLAAAAAWGRRFLVRLNLYHRSLTEEFIFSLLVGLVAFGLLSALLGAIGALYAWVLWLGVGLLLLTQWDHLEHFARELARNMRAKQPWDGSSGEVLALVAGALGLLAVLGLCLAPVTFYDALNYHLASVQRAVQTGMDLPQENNLFTWLPNLAQGPWIMASLLSGNDAASTLAPALLNFAMALVLGLALADASSRWLSERKLWFAAALIWTQPLLTLTFGTMSPDGWMATFCFMAFFAFLSATEEDETTRQGAWLGLMAFLMGAACAFKPVAALNALALTLLLAGELRTRPTWRRFSWGLVGALLFFLPLSPWVLKGAWLNGNPIYPFGLEAVGWVAGPRAYFETMQSFGVAWWQLPWTIFFQPNRLGGDGHLSSLLLALVPAALVWRYTPMLRHLRNYLILGAGLWLLGPKVLRYGLFALPAACLIAAHGVQEAEAWAASKGWAYAWRTLVLLGLFLGAGQTLLIATKNFQPWNVALGLQDPQVYLSEREVPQAEAAAWIRNRPGPRRILVLGDARTAYLPPKALAAGSFDVHPFRAWAAKAGSPQDLGAIVRRKGYDFVLFSRAEWARVEDPAKPFYWAHGDEATAERVRTWLQSLATDSARPRLELSHGAGWVFDLR